MSPGDIYNAEDVEKSLAGHHDRGREPRLRLRAGSPARRPRSRARGTIGVAYVVEEGPRVYIERINVRGNTRTRDYVIRREFDVGEGDAYNKILIDRAERRLNKLGYFKTCPHHQRAGLDARPRHRRTSTSRISRPASSRSPAAIRPRTASSPRSRSPRRNFLGRGQYVRVAGSIRPVLAGRRVLVHRALLHGPPHRGRLRPVLEGRRQHPLLLLREHDDRRHAAHGPADHRREHLSCCATRCTSTK